MDGNITLKLSNVGGTKNGAVIGGSPEAIDGYFAAAVPLLLLLLLLGVGSTDYYFYGEGVHNILRSRRNIRKKCKFCQIHVF